ncbi:uncharacterized protein LOC129924394 [Biomphalaria glabrata]|uniref:Uncharacterized protein LOC129924394 n=1 Tax=Biomphalaria glabrata TaxID=6526 RepID=A0A9W2ZHT0_BIOGL|nr:uncharacterized protein LOC129924394 [Biomphalaria glabrata]
MTHFLWLWNFTWSFICSYHMFRVFTSETRQLTTQQALPGITRKTMFSLCLPMLIVITTILSTYFLSDGRDIGYGLNSCYLNTTYLVGVTVIGPLSAISVCNVVFYIITVHKIHQVRRLQSSYLHDRQETQWQVYARLSSVTGSFWLVAILASALENTVLDLETEKRNCSKRTTNISIFDRFIHIVLNGLQGVAIFISFICNRRVWSLYREAFKQKQDTSSNQIS